MNLFWHDSKNLSSFFENNSKNWLLSKIWFKELNLFSNVTQRIESCFKYDSKNWISFWVWLRKIELFFFFFEYDSMNRSHFFECDSIEILVERVKKLNFFFFYSKLNFSSHDSKNWIFFFSIWLKELNPVLNMIQRIVFEFRLKELNILFFDSKSWAFFLLDAMHWTFFLFAAKNSLSHIGKQERFNSLSQKKDFNSFCHLEKKFIKRGSIRWVKSYFLKKKKFNSESHTKKVQFFESYQRKKLNPLSRIGEFQFFESYSKKKKVQCRKKKSHVQKKKKQVQFCESYWKKIQFCESYSYFKKKKNIFESHNEKEINSSSHFFEWKIFWKEGSSLWVTGSQILWVFFWWKKKTKSLSHVIKKGSTLRVILEKIFESY